MNDKEKIERVLNLINFLMENSMKQSEHAWYNDAMDKLVIMRNILTGHQQ